MVGSMMDVKNVTCDFLCLMNGGECDDCRECDEWRGVRWLAGGVMNG